MGDMRIKYVLWAFMLLGCGTDPFRNMNQEPEVIFARQQAELYFNLELKANVKLTDRETIKQTCLNTSAVACYTYGIVVISGPSTTDICQQTMHELGHAAELILTRAVDPTHTVNASYYNKIVFETCDKFM